MIGHNQTSFSLSSMQFNSHKNITTGFGEGLQALPIYACRIFIRFAQPMTKCMLLCLHYSRC